MRRPLARNAYALALKMLPRAFRERHEADMRRHFDALLTEERARPLLVSSFAASPMSSRARRNSTAPSRGDA